EKTYEVLRKCNLALVVVDIHIGITEFETEFIKQLKRRRIPCICVINKSDRDISEDLKTISTDDIPAVHVSAVTGFGIEKLKNVIVENSNFEDVEPALVSDLICPGDLLVLVTPIDKSAPKGRLILPQQQTIRDIIEKDAIALVTKEQKLKHVLGGLKIPPAMVITDSQAFKKVASDTPTEIPMTSFSILFARQKGDLAEMVRGIQQIKRLASGDKVLIVEGCTHQCQADDIGKVKIPGWIRGIAGDDIQFDFVSGAHFMEDLSEYALIVHCGGCMLNRREMLYRVEKAREQGVYITNYGVLIAYVMGILKRAIKPFPEASAVLEESNKNNEKEE
ncbi:MAG TPA: [FeFe] hydrogenase H-cluster maturation GTPase HydF, partial [Clostridiales bacterium]|nr:[FeFe] hydrogenase H-cluster maturation GTPase HydF [Clostridiales bacterium]